MDRFYVYGYFEQGSDLPFYIGKGHGNRAESHYNPSNLCKNTPFYRKLRELIALNTLPEIKYLAKEMTKEDAFTLKAILIAKYGRCLCNHTDVCHCTCHTYSGLHCFPCCLLCYICAKNIVYHCYKEHMKEHEYGLQIRRQLQPLQHEHDTPEMDDTNT